MYPDGESFDFESENQIALANYITATDPFQGMEISFPDKPLREGYRVRAVVYWTQNEELWLPKGNDYEAMFNRPDDSLLVAGNGTAQVEPSIAVAGEVLAGQETIDVDVAGTGAEGASVLVRSFPADATQFNRLDGSGASSVLAYVESVQVGTNAIALNSAAEEGRQIVAFLFNSSRDLAQSAPVVVGANSQEPRPTVSFAADSYDVSAPGVSVKVEGALPDGSILLVKSFPGDAASYAYDGGTLVKTLTTVSDFNWIRASDFTNPLAANTKLVAFLLTGGEVVAQSQPVAVSEPSVEPVVTLPEAIATTDRSIDVNIVGSAPEGSRIVVKKYASNQAIALGSGTFVTDGADAVLGANTMAVLDDVKLVRGEV